MPDLAKLCSNCVVEPAGDKNLHRSLLPQRSDLGKSQALACIPAAQVPQPSCDDRQLCERLRALANPSYCSRRSGCPMSRRSKTPTRSAELTSGSVLSFLSPVSGQGPQSRSRRESYSLPLEWRVRAQPAIPWRVVVRLLCPRNWRSTSGRPRPQCAV